MNDQRIPVFVPIGSRSSEPRAGGMTPTNLQYGSGGSRRREGWAYHGPRPLGPRRSSALLASLHQGWPWRLPLIALLMIVAVWVGGDRRTQTEADSGLPGADLSAHSVAAAGQDRIARRPLEASALRRLAFVRGLDRVEGAALLDLAHRVSRRDRETELALLERRAAAGDVPGSLRHYDALLLASPESRSLLFRQLATGLADPALRAALIRYRDRGWFSAFIKRAGGTDSDPRTALALAREAGLLAQPVQRDALAPALLAGLAASSATVEANWLADQLGRENWRAFGFSDVTRDQRLGPLAWRLQAGEGATAQWDEGAGLTILVEPLKRQIIARRETLYAPGTYRLAFMAGARDGIPADIEWRLTCPGSTNAIVVARVSAAVGALRQTQWPATVPGNCSRQVWTIGVAGGDASGPVGIEVSGVSLSRPEGS